ncbi:MAG: TraB/GumN family protein, partial [Deltaproteobacteria bacterium]|nr:TraB/GumN family protein [Deltaproteobacteria bacterium]
MLIGRLREKQLKTVWRVQRNDLCSYLVGTAHFFPYSFKKSLERLLRSSQTALFEGPLDKISMEKVPASGYVADSSETVLQELDERAVTTITNLLAPTRMDRNVLTGLQMFTSKPENLVYSMTKGMKPWLAFFTIYTRFLERNGWKHSVDMEAYNLARSMGKEVVFLETIEEQIDVLESLSLPQILDFLKRADRWKTYTKDFKNWYLEGDIEKIRSNPYRFPTHTPRVIDQRDTILYERMLMYLEKGKAAVFVGTPHVFGVSRL